MKKLITIAIIAIVALSFSFTIMEPATWSLDKNHARLGFSVTHMMVSDVEGWFKIFDAKVTSSNDDFSDAVAEMTAEVNSINTDNEQRDKHLKSPDFFDAAKYPVITFKSKSFKKTGDMNYKVTGDLTMHGITKTVELVAICRTATNPSSKQTIAGFKIAGKIKRSDFGIGTSMASGIVSDEVVIVANAEFLKN
ncbi:MAG TPA: YceI family protein [Bacteroidales bacterium]|nr:YceI family protein [Bacteroidales bacterium]